MKRNELTPEEMLEPHPELLPTHPDWAGKLPKQPPMQAFVPEWATEPVIEQAPKSTRPVSAPKSSKPIAGVTSKAPAQPPSKPHTGLRRRK